MVVCCGSLYIAVQYEGPRGLGGIFAESYNRRFSSELPVAWRSMATWVQG